MKIYELTLTQKHPCKCPDGNGEWVDDFYLDEIDFTFENVRELSGFILASLDHVDFEDIVISKKNKEEQ